MGVIRREQVAGLRPFSFEDVERRANELLAAARVQAGQIVRDAENQARQVTERRRREGYEQGLVAGREAGRQQACSEARAAAEQAARGEIDQLIRALRGGLAEYERGKRGLLAQAESGLIELALAIATRICKLTAGASSAAAQANCRTLLESVQHAHDVEVHFAPPDYERLAEVAPALAREVAGLEHVRIVADAEVVAGGCVIRTRDGLLDATLDTQLQRVAAAICGTGGDGASA